MAKYDTVSEWELENKRRQERLAKEVVIWHQNALKNYDHEMSRPDRTYNKFEEALITKSKAQKKGFDN